MSVYGSPAECSSETHAAAVHVVDVSPHSLEGNTGLTIIIHGLGDVKNVLITVPALVEAQTPVRLHGRQANNLCILLGYLNWTGSGDEIEIQDSADGVVFQILTGLGSIVDHDVHSVGVEKEDAVGARQPVLKVHGMMTIEVGAVWNPIGILRPQGPDIVCGIEPEGI